MKFLKALSQDPSRDRVVGKVTAVTPLTVLMSPDDPAGTPIEWRGKDSLPTVKVGDKVLLVRYGRSWIAVTRVVRA